MADDALTFEVHLGRRDLMRYFTRHYFFDRWSPWIVSLIMAIGLGYYYGFAPWDDADHRAYASPWVIAALVGGLAFVVIMASMFTLSTLIYGVRLWRLPDDGLLLEPRQISADAEGFTVTGSQTEVRFLWGKVERVRSSGSFLFLVPHGADMVIPWPLRQIPIQGAARIEGWWRSATADPKA